MWKVTIKTEYYSTVTSKQPHRTPSNAPPVDCHWDLSAVRYNAAFMPNFQYKPQPFQQQAVSAVLDMFRGVDLSPFSAMARAAQFRLRSDAAASAWRQPPAQPATPLAYLRDHYAGALHDNFTDIQQRNRIRPSRAPEGELGPYGVNYLTWGDYLTLDIQMETGTGKTFTFINTIWELATQHDITHFVIIVPSIAIKEGIKKAFDSTQPYFADKYGKSDDTRGTQKGSGTDETKPDSRFIKVVETGKAKSKKRGKTLPSGISEFIRNDSPTVLIMTNHAFNSVKNIVNQKTGRSLPADADTPMQAIAAKHPVLIIDEPQVVEGKETGERKGTKTRERIKNFNPLFVLRYSATYHPEQIKNPVYVLDSYDAFSQKLVKNITVTDYNAGQTDSAFIGLRRIVSGKAELEAADADGRPVLVRTGLERDGDGDGAVFAKTKNAAYRGLRVIEIDRPNNRVKLSDEDETALRAGFYQGRAAQNDEVITEIMLRDTIEQHLQKESMLFARGIKCLSLFFIDRVKDYRDYEADGAGFLQPLFERVYNQCVRNLLGDKERAKSISTEYRDYLNQQSAATAHGGYFSGDAKSNAHIDAGRAERADETARKLQQEITDLILRDKEKILQTDNPLRFIFAHSALREGWDNPNVFQICKLRAGYSDIGIVQEVGRGLRLCVNGDLQRQDESVLGGEFAATNRLHVFTLGNGKFIGELQKELSSRRSQLKISYVKIEEMFPQLFPLLSLADRSRLFLAMMDGGCVDDVGTILDPRGVADILRANGLDPTRFLEMAPEGRVIVPDVQDGRVRQLPVATYRANRENYEKFKRLWQLLHQKVVYQVLYSPDLIDNAAAKINRITDITPLRVTKTTDALQTGEGDFQVREKGAIMGAAQTLQSDMPAKTFYRQLSDKTDLPRNTLIRILMKIDDSVYQAARGNPFLAIERMAAAINSVIYKTVLDTIQYHKQDGQRDTMITLTDRTFEAARYIKLADYLDDYAQIGRSNNLWEDIAPYDSEHPEKDITVEALHSREIVVFGKLPRAVRIPTPMHSDGIGPDFAFVVRGANGDEQFYFVAEAKPEADTDELRREEQRRADFLRKYFDGINTYHTRVQFDVVRNYAQLLKLFSIARSKP